MGGSQSYEGLTEDLLEDYVTLTYLKKGEILYLMKKFMSIDPERVTQDYNHRFSKDKILDKFEVLRNNPFQDRLFHVFSSQNDGCFSFEDLVDLCSVMSPNCPAEVKAAWAFRVFDLDNDNQISRRDINEILDRLTRDPHHLLTIDEKAEIAKEVLDEMNMDKSGSVSLNEFQLLMTRIPEFKTSFYFKF